MELSLSGLNWEVKGYWPYVPLKEKSMETGQTLHGVTPWIPAKVPGGVHYDLWKAGYIENPYFGTKSLQCEWVENRWWMYRTNIPGDFKGVSLLYEKVKLLFHGLDYKAKVFFNDEYMGEHAGMYEVFDIDITGKIRELNTLVVLFEGIPQEMGQIGYTSRTSTQKSRFNYKWDFSTHLVNIGFWQDVTLCIEDPVSMNAFRIQSDFREGTGRILVKTEIQDERSSRLEPLHAELTVEGVHNCNHPDVCTLKNMNHNPYHVPQTKQLKQTEEAVLKPLGEDRYELEHTVFVNDPALWYPNGSGAQPLYTVTVRIKAGEKEEAVKEWNIGIRSVSYSHNEKEHVGALPYTFVINNRKIYMKGVNLTPLDHIYGNVCAEQYEHLIAVMVNAGVNMVRIWGGGLIEKEEFYRLCDENGILIWQELIQSSSGIDNKPCEDEEFLALLLKNAQAAVRQKRNHTALIVYSGGNELMEKENTPSGYDNRNLGLLKSMIEREDPERLFLPTSASGPREFLSEEKGVSHDVHGSWRYEGNPHHYKLYGESDNLFHSEFGMDGTACVKSLRKFLPKDALHPTPMSGNLNWQHHGEWWGTYFRDCEMFGMIDKSESSLPLFVSCSQYMQKEGLRFIIEADRRRAFQNSGVIIWQMNEPWPNASCTSLMDYYGEMKPAYYAAKNAFENLHISIDYRTLNPERGILCEYPVYLSDSTNGQEVRVEALVRSTDGQMMQRETWTVKTEGNKSCLAGTIPVKIPNEGGIFIVTVLAKGICSSRNDYIFSTMECDILSPLITQGANVCIAQEETTCLAEGRIYKKLQLVNKGTRVAVQTEVSLMEDAYWLLLNDNAITLFPEESAWVEALLIPKKAGTFLEEHIEDKGSGIQLSWLGQ